VYFGKFKSSTIKPILVHFYNETFCLSRSLFT